MTQSGTSDRGGQDQPEEIGGYIVERPLGQGGQATVFLARAADGSAVAVKLLSQLWLADAESRRRLDREIVAMRDVAPFAIARLLDARPAAHPPYLVTEYVPGPSLQEQVMRAGPLTGAALQRLAIATITGLFAVHHTGLVHRDVKPANVILGPDGARLVDFGIAGYAGEAEDADAGVLGTPAYLPPERLVGGPSAAASDVYAWAATMLFAATGKVPRPVVAGTPGPSGSSGKPESSVKPGLSGPPELDGLPAEFAAVLRQCLAPDPAARPSASQVLPLLVEAFDPKDLTVPFDPPPPAVPPGSGARGADRRATPPSTVSPAPATTGLSATVPARAVPAGSSSAPAPAPAAGGSGGGMPAWGSPASTSARASAATSSAAAPPAHRPVVSAGRSRFGSFVRKGLVALMLPGLFIARSALDSWTTALELGAAEPPAAVAPESVGVSLVNRMPVPWISADGRFVAVVDESGGLVRQPVSGGAADRRAGQVAAGAQPQDVSPDGTLLAAIEGGGRSGKGQVVTVTRVSGGEVARLPVDGPVRARFSGDGHHLLISSRGKATAPSSPPPLSPASPSPSSATGTASSARPTTSLLRAWDVRTWTVFREATQVREWAVGRGGHVVLADAIGLVTWDLGGGSVEMIPSLAPDASGTDPRDEVVALAISPDGRRVAMVTAGRRGVVEVWDVGYRSMMTALAPRGAPMSLAFLPDWDGLVVGSSVGTVQVYPFSYGGALGETPVWAGSSARVVTLRELRFSADGKVLAATRQEDKGIEVYRVRLP